MGEFVNKGKEPDQTSSALVDSAPGHQKIPKLSSGAFLLPVCF